MWIHRNGGAQARCNGRKTHWQWGNGCCSGVRHRVSVKITSVAVQRRYILKRTRSYAIKRRGEPTDGVQGIDSLALRRPWAGPFRRGGKNVAVTRRNRIHS
ncbi:protein of unknown function [Candidatus Methylocalor cossyra]|uniref:Uncharacterized protein n=1 Tax=Candidatus Methylocalor cossyra TaxID=3108543 RepID=A0ABP1C9B3_9GAMM